MARLRTLKPGFFTNDLLAEIPALGRLLFQGLWCIADREGRLEDRPRRIKAEVLPYDDVDVDALLNVLTERGFILRYLADGTGYIQVVNFAKHQTPHVKEQASTIPAPDMHSASTVQVPEQHATCTPSYLDPDPVVGTSSGNHTTVRANGMTDADGADAPPVQVAVPPSTAQSRRKTLTTVQQGRFDRWYAAYPKREHRPDAERAWRSLDPDDDLTERLIADAAARQNGRKWAQGFIELPASYLNKRVWEDDIEDTWRYAATNGNGRVSNEQAKYDRSIAALHRLGEH